MADAVEPNKEALIQKIMDESKEHSENCASTVGLERSVEVSLTVEKRLESSKTKWSCRESLKLGQIITGIMILVLMYPWSIYYYQALPEYTLLFVTYNATIVTLALLIDSMTAGQRLRKAFTPKCWAHVSLWYTGLISVLFHVLAYWVLVVALTKYTNPEINAATSGVGFVTAGLYLIDWWITFQNQNHSENVLETNIVEDTPRDEVVM